MRLQKRLSHTSSRSSLIPFSKQDWGNRLSDFIESIQEIVPDVISSQPNLCTSFYKRTHRTKITTEIVLMLRLKSDSLLPDQKENCIQAIDNLLDDLETLHRHKSHDAKVDKLRVSLAKTRDVLQQTRAVAWEETAPTRSDLSKVLFSRQPLSQLMQAAALAAPALRDTGNALFTGLNYILGAAKADGWDEMALVVQGSGLPSLFPTLIYTQFSVLLLFIGLPNVIHELHGHAGDYREIKSELAKRADELNQVIEKIDLMFNERLNTSFKDLLRKSLFAQFEKTPSKLKALRSSFPSLELSQSAFKTWKKDPNRQNVEQSLQEICARFQQGHQAFTAEDQATLEEGFKDVLSIHAEVHDAQQEVIGNSLELVTFLGMGTGMGCKAVAAFLDEASLIGQNSLDLISTTLGGALLGLGQVACMAGATYDSLAVVTLILRRHFESTFQGREFTFKDSVKALARGIDWKTIEPELRQELLKHRPADVMPDDSDAYVSGVIRDVKCDFDQAISKLRGRLFNNSLIFAGQGILLLGVINTLWTFGFSTLISAVIGGPITIYAIIRNLLNKSQDASQAKKYPHMSHGEDIKMTSEKKREALCHDLTRSAVKLSIHRKLAKGDSGIEMAKRWEKENGFFNKSPFWRAPIANAKAYKSVAMSTITEENESYQHNDPSKSYYENYAVYYREHRIEQEGKFRMSRIDFVKVATNSLGRLWNKKKVSQEDLVHFALDFQQHPQRAAKIRRALIALSEKEGKPFTHETLIKRCLETPRLQKMILDMLYDRTMEDIARLRKSGYRFEEQKKSQPAGGFQFSTEFQDDVIF